MAWGEGRFLSELPREAPEVGGLDSIDPESSIICWLSTTVVLQIIHRPAVPSHHGEETKGHWEVPAWRHHPTGSGTEMASASWKKMALACCRLGVGELKQSRGCGLALQLPCLTPERRLGTKGAPVCPRHTCLLESGLGKRM